MSEMVERVARALCQKAGDDPNQMFRVGNNLDDLKQGWELHLEDARAAIEAMREPTDEMLWDGGSVIPSIGTDAEPVWQAMIDAALRASE